MAVPLNLSQESFQKFCFHCDFDCATLRSKPKPKPKKYVKKKRKINTNKVYRFSRLAMLQNDHSEWSDCKEPVVVVVYGDKGEVTTKDELGFRGNHLFSGVLSSWSLVGGLITQLK